MNIDSIYVNRPDLSISDITNLIKDNIDNFDNLDDQLPSLGQIIEIKDIPINDSFRSESLSISSFS